MISPNRLRQPVNMRLFQQQVTRMTRDVMEQVMKARMAAGMLVVDNQKARIGCGKHEGWNECGLANCDVCTVDESVEYLHQLMADFCSTSRSYEATEDAIDAIQSCCLLAKKNPSLLLTNTNWANCLSKVLFELVRVALEVYATTDELDVGKLQMVLAELDYVYEGLKKDQRFANAKFCFEVFDENPEDTPLKVIPIQDFYSEEEIEEHMLSLTMNFRAGFATRQLPTKAFEWDGRVQSAEGYLKTRANKDVYLIRIPSGERIAKQIMCAGLFDTDKGIFLGMQPDAVAGNNKNPHWHLVPDRRSIGRRLIVD